MGADDLLGGRYRRVRLVGSGGMGEVWQGEDTLLERRVAIKRILAHGLQSDPTLHDRLLREARLAARLDHSHAVTVHDVVVEDDQPHLVMQFVDGHTLAERLAGGTIADQDVARLLAGVADALAEAHALGIVHRDIKPANVLVDLRGRALLADFGIARGDVDSRLTGTGEFIGTPAFLAPELARGERAGPASDVYALGATMYAALDGRAPFDDGESNPLALLSRLLTRSVEPPRNAGVLTGLVMAMLAPDPSARPSAAAVAAALSAHTTVPAPAPAPNDRPTRAVSLPPRPAATPAGDPLETLLGAIDHSAVVTGGWSGTVDEWETLVIGEIGPVLGEGDRVDLFVPTLFGVDERQRTGLPRQVLRSLGELRAGVTVTLADRLVCAWTTNYRTLAHISITIEYARIVAVRAASYETDDADFGGIELDCGEFTWPILFGNEPQLESLRYLLAGRPTGAVTPRWHIGEVASWVVPDGRGGTTELPGWRTQ